MIRDEEPNGDGGSYTSAHDVIDRQAAIGMAQLHAEAGLPSPADAARLLSERMPLTIALLLELHDVEACLCRNGRVCSVVYPDGRAICDACGKIMVHSSLFAFLDRSGVGKADQLAIVRVVHRAGL